MNRLIDPTIEAMPVETRKGMLLSDVTYLVSDPPTEFRVTGYFDALGR